MIHLFIIYLHVYVHICLGKGEYGMKTIPSLSSNNILSNISDSLIASEWQKNQFDIKHVTSGSVSLKDIMTKGGINMDEQKDDNVHTIQIENDALISMNVSENQSDLHSLTKGKLSKDNWLTKK